MDDTVKIVIELPKKVFEARKMGEISPWVTVPILDAVRNGIPFDDIKKEVWLTDFDFGDYSDHTEEIQDKVIGILDNIGKKARE